MTISIQYNGIELTNYLDAVIDITRNVGQNRTPSLVKVGHTDGQRFQYTTASEGTITITAIIRNQKTERRRALAQALMQSEPAKLIFSDEPGLYYLAITTGQQTLAEQFLHNTLTLTFVVPDGIAHSLTTQTADNMPYKDVPVNFAIASHASGSNTTSNDAYPIHMQLSEDLSGKTITTVAKVIVTNYQGKVDSTNSGGPYIDVKDGLSTGNWPGLINQIRITGNGVYTSSPKTIVKNPLTGTANNIDVEMYNLNATIEVWIKVEIGTTASSWSPNPADPEYYQDTITVHNGGTYPAYPVIEATMHGDNGVLALINEDNGGVLQFGNAEEIDGEIEQKSEQVIHDTFSGGKPDSNVTTNAGTIFFNDSGRSKIEGGFTSSETKDAVVPTFIGTSSDRWNGPTLHGDIPATVEGKNTGNFLFENRVNFTAAVGHNGRVEFILNSPDGVAMVLVLRDTITTKKQLVIEAWCMGEQLAQEVVDLGSFNSNFFDLQMGRIGSQLLFQIAKISNLNGDVPSYASKITLTPTFSGFADVPITSMTSWFSRFGNHEESDMAWTDSKFTWTNISYWNDLANTFSNGDVVTIDTGNRGIALNGVNVSGLQSIDNDWGKFGLLPGTNHISINCSSFSKTPTVTATIREAFL